MDKVIKDFIIRNNLDLNNLRMMPEWLLYNIKDKNVLAKNYGIYNPRKIINVSVADIIGYEYQNNGGSRDLIDNMECFFQDDGDNYHTRANGMLEYTSNNILEKLNASFNVEHIVMNEVDGNYFISVNGFHRFHIMRILYLNELVQADNDYDKRRIMDKYTIIAKVNSIDYIKTYCNFILSQLYSYCWLSNEYDSNCNRTGRTELKIDNKILIMTDEELIQFTLEKINEKEFDKRNFEKFNFVIQDNCNNITSFRFFIDSYFGNIFENEIDCKCTFLKQIKKKVLTRI